MGWRVRFDTWRVPPPTPVPPLTAGTTGSAPERRRIEPRVSDILTPRTPPPSPSAHVPSLTQQLETPLKRRGSDASTAKASKRLRELAARSARESSLLVMPRMEERLTGSAIDSNRWRSFNRRSLKPIMELPSVTEADQSEVATEAGRGSVRSRRPSAEVDLNDPVPMDTDTALPTIPEDWVKPSPEGIMTDLPKLMEPDESFRLMLDSESELVPIPPRRRLLSDEMERMDASTMRDTTGKRRRSSTSSGTKEDRVARGPAPHGDVRFRLEPVESPEKPTAAGEPPKEPSDPAKEGSEEPQRRASVGGPTFTRALEGVPLLWKTSRGPMAREPPPRRRSSLPPALAPPEPPLPGMLPLPPKAPDGIERPTPVPRVAPAKVLYAAPLERSSLRGQRESMDSAADEELKQPVKKPAAVPLEPLPRIPSYMDVRWLKDYPAATTYRPEPFIRGRKHRRRSGDSQVSDVSGPMDEEEAEEKELQLLELNPEDDSTVERLQERHLIKRGRAAYRRLMAGETKSMQDVYKMMLDLAWRHRDDPIPPPLPPPPPPESSRPPPRVQLLRPKMRKLPPRPAKPIEALPSDETFYAAAAERAMSNSRRPSAERGTTIWGRAEARRSSYPRPTVDLRPSVLLDPASWAPPDAGRRLSDPRAPPPPGRVPRGWINIMEIGAPT